MDHGSRVDVAGLPAGAVVGLLAGFFAGPLPAVAVPTAIAETLRRVRPDRGDDLAAVFAAAYRVLCSRTGTVADEPADTWLVAPAGSADDHDSHLLAAAAVLSFDATLAVDVVGPSIGSVEGSPIVGGPTGDGPGDAARLDDDPWSLDLLPAVGTPYRGRPSARRH